MCKMPYKIIIPKYNSETAESYRNATAALQIICGEELKTHYNNEENDLYTSHMVELFQSESIAIRTSVLKIIHKVLFSDIYDFAGEYRSFNIDGFADCKEVDDIIKNQITIEREQKYSKMSKHDIVKRACELSAKLYFTYPFPEGNLQTIALFMYLYYRGIGFNVDISAFSDSAVNYKNALNKSVKLNDFSELERFYGRFLFREGET